MKQLFFILLVSLLILFYFNGNGQSFSFSLNGNKVNISLPQHDFSLVTKDKNTQATPAKQPSQESTNISKIITTAKGYECVAGQLVTGEVVAKMNTPTEYSVCYDGCIFTAVQVTQADFKYDTKNFKSMNEFYTVKYFTVNALWQQTDIECYAPPTITITASRSK